MAPYHPTIEALRNIYSEWLGTEEMVQQLGVLSTLPENEFSFSKSGILFLHSHTYTDT